jgi:transposase-like protein
METAVMPVLKGGWKRWTVEQKFSVLREWKEGLPVQELCRRHGLHANQLYRWKPALERGFGGELIPKGQVIGLQPKVEELQRALGRKSLEVAILKKVFELKSLKLPKGT